MGTQTETEIERERERESGTCMYGEGAAVGGQGLRA